MDNENKNYSQPEQVSQNTALENPWPASRPETVQNTFQVPNYQQPVIAYQGNQDDKRLIIRNATLGVLILIVFIAGVFLAFSLQHKSTKNLESKLSQNSQGAEISKTSFL